jgi:hypothetical protein
MAMIRRRLVRQVELDIPDDMVTLYLSARPSGGLGWGLGFDAVLGAGASIGTAGRTLR